MAKACIMLVRLLGLAAIVVGVLMWMHAYDPYLKPHLALGFCVVTLVFVMGVIALTKRAVGLGIAGILLALLLPMVGFLQLPLVARAMGGMQVAHIAVALCALGVAERLYSVMRS
ncbi:MAG: hypothetical protein WA532_11985 [Candidatus Korobacteraceae bacterium]